MKGITPPCNDPKWTQKYNCPDCGALLEVERSDLYTKKIQGAYQKIMVQCTCMFCNATITIDEFSPKWGCLPAYKQG